MHNINPTKQRVWAIITLSSVFRSLKFSLSEFFVSLIRFIYRYFFFIEAVGNMSMSMTSFPVCLLVVYRKPINFYKLVYYLVTHLSIFFIISMSFLVAFLDSLMYSVMTSAYRDCLTSFFLFWIPLIYFSCFIDLVLLRINAQNS